MPKFKGKIFSKKLLNMRGKTIVLYEDQFSYHPCSRLIYDPIIYHEETNKHLHQSIICEFEYLDDVDTFHNNCNKYIEEYINIIKSAVTISEFCTLKDILVSEIDMIDRLNKDSNKRDKDSIEYKGFLLSRLTYYGLDKNIKDARVTLNYDEMRMMIFSVECEK